MFDLPFAATAFCVNDDEVAKKVAFSEAVWVREGGGGLPVEEQPHLVKVFSKAFNCKMIFWR